MNHVLIKNERLLQKFIDWLPNLQENEVFLIALQARKKYMPTLQSSDKTELKRVTCKKHDLIHKIRQMEVEVGTYKTKSGEIITDDALALYITVNPRCLKKATFNTMKILMDNLESGQIKNPHSEAMTAIHRAKSRTYFVHFDIDGQDAETVRYYGKEIVGEYAITVVKTRGGAHLLIKPEIVLGEKNWHKRIQEELNCDQIGDLMLPIVGCCQGNFMPVFYGNDT